MDALGDAEGISGEVRAVPNAPLGRTRKTLKPPCGSLWSWTVPSSTASSGVPAAHIRS
jgi:hypothetical protein